MSVVGTAGETPSWVFCGSDASPVAEGILRAKGLEVFRVTAAAGRLDLGEVLKLLSERGITRLMVEGGPTVAAAFVHANLVDEVALFRAPKVIGPDGIDALEGLPLEALTQSSHLKSIASEAIGDDTVERFERV
jgi:diaminohydroxyphosphoribosylaminopyrimidine deaminase/5-amino-6-(5-phosphoribosylamino)uracil reductase